MGMTPSGYPFVAYSLTGRSPPSQARELLVGENTGVIRTSAITDDAELEEMFDISSKSELYTLKEKIKGGSPALIYYPAIIPMNNNILLASNGAQTTLLYNTSHTNLGLITPYEVIDRTFRNQFLDHDPKDDVMIDLTSYEPDHPNNTPRISGVLINNEAALCIVRKKDEGGQEEKELHSFALQPGEGKLITTYRGENESPLEPFRGDPLSVGIGSDNAIDIAKSVYSAIYGGQEEGDNYRVAAAVALFRDGRLETAIRNRVNQGD